MNAPCAARNAAGAVPELPEVETIRRMLAPRLVGRRLVEARVEGPCLRTPWPDLRVLVGRRLVRLDRRGKWLLWRFAGRRVLLQHFGMTGAWFPLAQAPAIHRHFVLVWERETLAYVDPRRFGMLLLLDERGVRDRLACLGPEPEGLTADDLLARAGMSRRSLHAALLDERVVAGVGNIYANEACWRACLHPARRCCTLADADWVRLAKAIRAAISAALAAGGTTIRDFARPDGTPGYFRQHLAVYGRGGFPCPRCAAPIRRLRLGGRSAYACPVCQPLPE